MSSVRIPDPGGDLAAMATAVDQLPFIVAACEGPQLTVVACTAATRAAMPGRQLVGLPIAEALAPLAAQQWVDAYHEVYRTGRPITGRQWRAHLPLPDGSVHEMFASFTIVPWLRPDGSLRGVIGAGFDVTDAVRAQQAAVAERTRLQRDYERSREVITALQQALLPPGLPVLPGLQLAASYLPADAGAAAGGDWFDAVARGDGRVALVVGDVVGHGVTASGVMGQLRAVLHERLDAGVAIDEALAAADRFAARLPAAYATTVCVALLDPVGGELAYCTAGHPPPLVIAADGGARYLARSGAGPLRTGGRFTVRADRLAAGELILLHSDGILERPGATGDGAAELARVAADTAAGRALHDPRATAVERVCTQTVELLVRAGGHADDITLLAAQRVPTVPDLALSLPPQTGSLSDSRARIGAWLARVGAGEQDTFVLQHALGELTTNAIEHPLGDPDQPVEIRATLTAAGAVEATVSDHGGWRAPRRRPIRGRGLALTAQLVESLVVEPGEAGTVASVRHTLTRPARLLDRFGPTPATPPQPDALTITELDGDREHQVRLDGPLDALTATVAQHELMRRSRGGAAPMTVDLTGVSHLASAGMSMLYRIAQQHAEQKSPLTLVAEPGSPARHILDLVGLPHTVAPIE